MPKFSPKQSTRVPRGTFTHLHCFSQIVSYVIGAFHHKFTSLIPNPDNLILGQVMTQWHLQDGLNLKGKKSSTKNINSPPFGFRINERGDHREYKVMVLGGDDPISGRCWEPSILPYVDLFPIPDSPPGSTSNDF